MNWSSLLVFLVSSSVAGLAGPVGMARLDQLIDNSKNIVVAKVVSGTQSGFLASVVLDVQRILKGSLNASILSVEITVSSEFSASRSLAGLQGIWFLTDGTGGIHRALPPMMGSVPLEFFILPGLADLPAAWAPDPSATSAEKVLRELAATLEANGDSNLGVAREFLSQTPVTSASSLRGLYQRMVISPADIVSLAGLTGLLRSGDAASLTSVKQKLAQGRVGRAAVSGIAQAVCEYSNANPQGLAVLAELAGTSQSVPRLQECAAFALRSIHSHETVPALLVLLDNSNPSVRYEAVAGLASYANSGSIPNEKPLVIDGVVQQRQSASLRTKETEDNFPTLDTFRKGEQRFTAFWKA